MQPESSEKTGKDILALLADISDKTAVKHKLVKTVIVLAEKDRFLLAEEAGLSIPDAGTRQEIWKTIGYTKAKESGGRNAFASAHQFAHEETIRYFRQGIVKYCMRLNNIKEALPVLREISNDTQSMEPLLKHVAINEVFQGNPDPEIVQRINNSLNIQWAIDMVRNITLKE